MIKTTHHLFISAKTIEASQFKLLIEYGGCVPRITLKVWFQLVESEFLFLILLVRIYVTSCMLLTLLAFKAF